MGITRAITPANDDQAPSAEAATHGPSQADALEAALRDMTGNFVRDLVTGRMGLRHNTYEHRSRILRQLGAQLSAMRADASSQTS